MPLARYFLLVGGALLALLFISDAYLPKLSVAAGTNPDLPMIRIHIHSDQKWPERVVFDTSLPTIVPAENANKDTSATAPAMVADVSAKAQMREAFAQLQPSNSEKPQPKLQRKRKIAKNRATPMALLAERPQFGWFGHSIW